MNAQLKRLTAVLGTLTLTCTLFAGCGGSGGTPSKGSTEGKAIDDDAAEKMFEGNTEQPKQDK